MLDRYIQWTHEHQAELQLDAVNQRLLAQVRLTAPTHVPSSSGITRLPCGGDTPSEDCCRARPLRADAH